MAERNWIELDETWHIPGGEPSALGDLARMGRKHDVRFIVTDEEEKRLLAKIEALNDDLRRLRDYREHKEQESAKALARWEGEGGHAS